MNDPPVPPERQTFISTSTPVETDPDTVQVEGVLERIVFESPESGFIVGRLSIPDQTELLTFVGAMLAVSPGDTVRLWGKWEDHPKHGRQLRVLRFETILPSTVDGIERYLGSGLVPGIGRTMAKRIVDKFGVETLRVIDETPHRLRAVEGIGAKRARQIREAWREQRAVQSIMIFLQGHGVPVGQAVRIYKRYGDRAIAVLRDNPYRLATDIAGIAFKSADAIAAELGMARDAPQRLVAGCRYCLDEAAGEGHVYLPRDALIQRAAEILSVDAALVEQTLAAGAAAGDLCGDPDRVYLPRFHQAEVGAAELLRKLRDAPMPEIPIQVERAVEWVEKTKQIKLSPEQRDVIRTAINAKVMVITGGPGAGKTTVLNSLLEILAVKGVSMLLAAPTGRAAKRMENATGRPAATLHRLLEFSPKTGRFTRDPERPLDTDLLVIDESSMLDILLFHNTLRALPPEARLILVGDVDQLPSVGPGNVLLDVISSNIAPTVWLRTVFRQAAQSGIIRNAHRINRGEQPEFNTDDFFFVERTDPAQARETVVELAARRIPRKFRLDPKRDIQVLAPMHRGEAGVSALNDALRAALNPDAPTIERRPFGLGDKVMQLRNNYELDVFNGDVGIIVKNDAEMKEIEVAFDDRRVIYPYALLDELAPAYAGTVHKAQGSEYPAIVMPLLPQHYVMLQRNIVYTGVTRASRLVIIVGHPRALARAIANTHVTRRFTALSERLQGLL